MGATRCVAPTVTVRGRGSGSPSPLFCCACRVGGGVALPHPVTLRALIEAFLGNSDCATALLFPPGQMTSTGVAGLPGRRVGAQHRCAPIIWSGGFLGATRRGWATHRGGGDASRRPYDMVGWGFWGRRIAGGATHRVAPTIWSGGVFGGATRRGWATHRGGRRTAWGATHRVGGGRSSATPLQSIARGATHRGGAMHRGGGRRTAWGATRRRWATHRVAPTIWSGGVFGGVAPLRRGVPLRPYNGCIRAGPVA